MRQLHGWSGGGPRRPAAAAREQEVKGSENLAIVTRNTQRKNVASPPNQIQQFDAFGK
jgi:hypothetical protein